MGNAREFRLALDVAAERFRAEATELHREVHVALHEGLVEETPKRTGQAAAGWTPSIGSPAVGAPAEGLGSYRAPDARAALAGLKLGDVSFETNNVPHIGVLNDGSSKQAGAGFVERVSDRVGGAP